MKRVSWFSKAVRHSSFPLLLLLLANLIAGIFTFQDYGLSWDEPLFYAYGEAIPYAYSISARLSGNFDIEQAYGPSAEDHKIYGPAYLLLTKPVVDLLDWAFTIPRADLWHLVNFITFQIGVALLYALCLRWMSSWAAFGASLLFSTQPVIWGHAWINPKDIPFTVFFLATLYLGFKMVDTLSDPSGEIGAVSLADNTAEIDKRRRRWKAVRIVALIFTALSLVSFIFASQLQELLGSLIHTAYQSPPGSFLGKLFGTLAANAQTIPEDAYINKGLILFARLRKVMASVSLIFLIPALVYTFWPGIIERFRGWLAKTLAPLPEKPAWGWHKLSSPRVLISVVASGILLGILVSIRVIGPLAGVLVCLYFIFKPGRRSLAGMLVYGVITFLALYLVWPYLWGDPLGRFINVLQHMSHNPQTLPVLFNKIVYSSDKLPVAYLPVMLGITLTWPVWLLFAAGVVVSWLRINSKRVDWRSLTPIFLWFLLPFVYVLILRPPVYDGYRHFLFILPPVFILIGMALQAIVERLRTTWRYALVVVVLVIPGVIGLVRLHPYEYTYYNQLVGGTGGAFRRYETDFWLTCYKELVAQVNNEAAPGTDIFVLRQPSIARVYASPQLKIDRFDPEEDLTFSGSLLLLTTRANVDLTLHPEAPVILSVGREGADFCLVKAIP